MLLDLEKIKQFLNTNFLCEAFFKNYINLCFCVNNLRKWLLLLQILTYNYVIQQQHHLQERSVQQQRRRMKNNYDFEIRKSYNNSTIDENVRFQSKYQKANDCVSAIEEVGDSFVSGADILKQFENLGIQIENVDINDQSESNHRTSRDKLNLNGQPQIRVHFSGDDVLDYSKIAKMKEKQYQKISKSFFHPERLRMLKNVMNLIKEYKNKISQAKIDLRKVLEKGQEQIKRSMDLYLKKILKKLEEDKFFFQQEKQETKRKQKLMQLKMEQMMKQNKRLKQENMNAKELAKSRNNQSGKPKLQYLDFKQKQLQAKRVRSQQAAIKQKELELKMMASENEKLQKCVQDLTKQNLVLRQELKKTQRRIYQAIQQTKSEQSQKNYQTYNRFLEQINILERQIVEMKEKQNKQKQDQEEEWKIQINRDMNQKEKYLQICEENEKLFALRQKDSVKKQAKINYQKDYDFKVKSNLFPEVQYATIQTQNLRASNGSYNKPRFSLKIQSARNYKGPRVQTQNPVSINQKDPYLSPIKHYQQSFYSARLASNKKLGSKKKPSSIGHTKYSNQLNCRLEKISSSIQSELQHLRFRN